MFSLPILWFSQSWDQPCVAIYQIWKLPKKNSICLVAHWNLFIITKWQFWIFSILEIWGIWLKFSLNILHIRAFFPIFFHIGIGKCFPQNGQNSWMYTRKTHFPKIFLIFWSKMAKEWKKPLLCKGRNHTFQVELCWKFANKKNHCNWTDLHFHKQFCLFSQISVPTYFRSNSGTMYYPECWPISHHIFVSTLRANLDEGPRSKD